MTQQEELEGFIKSWGGPARFHVLVEKCGVSPDVSFANELSLLVERNAVARSKVTDIFRATSANGQLGDHITKSYQGTCETHGASTADDFFKAKSSAYLLNAEAQNLLDENALNIEEGWPDSGKDIGEF